MDKWKFLKLTIKNSQILHPNKKPKNRTNEVQFPINLKHWRTLKKKTEAKKLKNKKNFFSDFENPKRKKKECKNLTLKPLNKGFLLHFRVKFFRSILECNIEQWKWKNLWFKNKQ